MSDLPRRIQDYVSRVDEFLARDRDGPQYPFLSQGFAYQLATGGKRLRPALSLLTCDTFGGDPDAALPFAAASEILHNFLLVHDDIEDGDTVRRDKATLWVKEGVPNALNVADFMIARAYTLILEAPLAATTRLRLAQVFTHALHKTIQGQALDINLRGSPDVDLAKYYTIVRLKTAYYLALTWVGGAIVAGAAEGIIEPLWDLGRCLGPAFQIRDDIIDLSDGKGRGGEVGCDIREGKPSILYAYVLDRRPGSEVDRQRLCEIIRRSRAETTARDIEWAIEYFRRHGAIEFAQSEAQRLAAESRAIVDSLPMSEEGRQGFREVIDFVIDRRI